MDFLNLLARLADLDTTATLPAAAPRRAALGRLGQAGTALLPALLLLAYYPSPPPLPLTIPAPASMYCCWPAKLRLLENEFYSRALGLVAGVAAVPLSATEKTAIQTIAAARGSARSAVFATDYRRRWHPARYVRATTSLAAKTVPSPRSTPISRPTPTRSCGSPAAGGCRRARLQGPGRIRAVDDDYLLEAVVRAHSTEARHASHIRTMRRQRGATSKAG